ncbi:MAG: hypothetical protein LBQ22_09130 [Bacteroidales bacterium]|jgi:predicted glutamine amidotransferase|nr:hypothetical protein [Bacteroidales bacterium]
MQFNFVELRFAPVAIMRGVRPQKVPVGLSHVHARTSIRVPMYYKAAERYRSYKTEQMMKNEWNLYTKTKSDIKVSTDVAKRIISKIGELFLPFFCSTDKARKRTTKLFEVLTELGDNLGYKVYSNGLSKEFLDMHNNRFKNREWLYDLHWYTEKEDKGYMPLTFPLIVECEWKKRK